jgi:hypothetical protein
LRLNACGDWVLQIFNNRILRCTSPLFRDKQINDSFHDSIEDFPAADLWYSTLIALTQQAPESERLLNGAGNLQLPAGAFFTTCQLTSAGRIVAEQLLAEHPEWRTRLTSQ